MQMIIKLWEHKKQAFPITIFNYDNPMLITNNKLKNQSQILEFKI
jgi:hypothetical protein